MNRDEKLARPAGLPPKEKMVNGHVALCPSEPGDGTWIAVNDQGVTLALINWYSIAASVGDKGESKQDVTRPRLTSRNAYGSPTHRHHRHFCAGAD